MDRRLHWRSAMSRPRGFTLVEVLIALGLIATVSAGSGQLVVWTLRRAALSQRAFEMSLAAANKIAELSVAAAAGTLSTSPADSLDRHVDGYTDLVATTGWERRWLIASVDRYGGRALAIAVRVIPPPGTPAGDVQIVTICRMGP